VPPNWKSAAVRPVTDCERTKECEIVPLVEMFVGEVWLVLKTDTAGESSVKVIDKVCDAALQVAPPAPPQF
jgi:hypothetical protein